MKCENGFFHNLLSETKNENFYSKILTQNYYLPDHQLIILRHHLVTIFMKNDVTYYYFSVKLRGTSFLCFGMLFVE